MEQQKISISERRATYPLQQRLKIYGPDSMAQRLNQGKSKSKLLVHGVNILNKASLDSDTILDRLKQRRETHNRIERRRRDMLNTLINEIAQTIPHTATSEPEKCHRAEVLRQAINYIKTMQIENTSLRQQLNVYQSHHHNSGNSTTPTSTTSTTTPSSL